MTADVFQELTMNDIDDVSGGCPPCAWGAGVAVGIGIAYLVKRF